MKVHHILIGLLLAFTSTAQTFADTSIDILGHLKKAFETNNQKFLKDAKWFGVITGDLPMRSGLHNPSMQRSDPDGLRQAIPQLYNVADISVVQLAQIPETYHVGNGKTFIRVEFKLKKKDEHCTFITEFLRFYPLIETDSKTSLLYAE